MDAKKKVEPNVPKSQGGGHASLSVAILVSINLVPHFPDMPMIATVGAIGSLVWGLMSLLHLARPIPKRIVVVANIGTLIGLYLHYGTLVGYEPASCYLVMLATFKIAEMRDYRDKMILLFLCFYLIMAKLLTSQSLPMLGLVLFDILAITSLLRKLQVPENTTQFLPKYASWRLLIQASPLFIALFFLFPRINTGFLSLGTEPKAITGFSDQLHPGDIAQLSQSNEVAFKAHFKDDVIPAMNARYWRGGILWESYGMRWRKTEEQVDVSDRLRPFTHDPGFAYDVILEPRFGRWLFTFDTPIRLTFGDPRKQLELTYEQGRVFRTLYPIGHTVLYAAHSQIEPPSHDLSPQERRLYLQTPSRSDQRLEHILRELEGGVDVRGRSEVLAHRMLEYFRTRPFTYTLQPGPLPDDAVSTFLLDTQRGFCEHYAAAFGTVMRYLGVPSRIVIGFQGGIQNDFDRTLIVRDQDAHAWNEIWSDEKKRWMRIDPTTAVASARVELGGQMFHNIDMTKYPGLSPQEILDMARGTFGSVLSSLLMGFEAIANAWNRQILQFDFEYQQEFLSAIGLDDVPGAFLIGAIVIIVGLLFYLLTQKIRREFAVKASPELILYRRLLRLLGKFGLSLRPGEPPSTFGQRCLAALSLTQSRSTIQVLEDFFRDYEVLRFAPPSSVSHESGSRVLARHLRTLRRQLKVKKPKT